MLLIFPLEDKHGANAETQESPRVETRPIGPYRMHRNPARRYLSLYFMFQLSPKWKDKMGRRDKGPALYTAGSPGTGCCYDKHSDQNQLGEGMGLFDHVTVHHQWKPGQELKAGNVEVRTEAETTEECSLLACSRLMFSYLSYSAQDNLPRHGSTHNGLGPLT